MASDPDVGLLLSRDFVESVAKSLNALPPHPIRLRFASADRPPHKGEVVQMRTPLTGENALCVSRNRVPLPAPDEVICHARHQGDPG